MWIYYVNLKLQVEMENNNDFKIKLLQITSFRGRWVGYFSNIYALLKLFE